MKKECVVLNGTRILGNLFTDYGFKKIFGEEPNKNLLLDFLNELLKEEQGEIRDLTYLKTDQLGDTDIDRKAIFDLYWKRGRIYFSMNTRANVLKK
ncbi:MAG: PD-(D/E)XK nuclease family transposase [Candidatus Electrothrix sp. GW3-4]|uniref:PD-(D/E)XK nuclease family transposase n=1 Tax=Candidatus Electrothrix sp. GW3-4 TaxID=3126740 RepID=UPI0030D0082F